MLYVGVVVPFDLLDAEHLVAQVDQHVADRLNKIASLRGEGKQVHSRLPSDNDVDMAPVVIWARTDRHGHTVPVTTGASPLSPNVWSRTGQPSSVVTQSGEFRLLAARIGNGWLVAGESLAETQHVEAVVGRVELIAGPVLVLSMFFAALAIGLMNSRPLEQTRRCQLEFTADASHELRTPIAVIHAEVALALSSPRDSASYRGTLRRIGKEGKRLRHIVEDLLFLARFDARPQVPGDEPVDLVALAGAGVSRFAGEAESKNIHLTVIPTSANAALVGAPPGWVDRLCDVLIDNACRYAGEGGTVSVIVGAKRRVVSLAVEGSVRGSHQNNGPCCSRGSIGPAILATASGLGWLSRAPVASSTGGKWKVVNVRGGGAHIEVLWRRRYRWDSAPALHLWPF